MAKPYTVTKWEFIDSGGEATAYKGTLNLEKATQGAVGYPKKLEVVHRIDSSGAGSAQYSFVRNLATAILDTYFYLSDRYKHRHVPQPVCLSEGIGLPDNGYVYQYAHGSERFPWNFDGNVVILEEWRPFCASFYQIGIDVSHDVTDTDNGNISKNIILAEWDVGTLIKTGTLPANWARIDFGYQSLPVSWEKLDKFVVENEKQIRAKLGSMADVLKLSTLTDFKKLDLRELVDKYYKELYNSDIDFFTLV